MYKQKNKQRGITLIVLVVSIIVLLILAGVSIAMLVGENGIITQAQRAAQETEQAQVEEKRQLAMLEASVHLEEYEYTDINGEKVNIPAQCTVSKVEGENTLENGLVIIDVNGNEWVWIEVPKNEMPEGLTFENETEYETLEVALQTYAKDYRESGYTDTWYDGCGLEQDEYINLKQDMLKSIYENEGFYIGRYETGIKEDKNRKYGTDYTSEHEINEIPVIQQDKYVYNWIRCSQAQELSKRLSVGEKTSSLMFGIQWDLVLKYLEINEVSQEDLKTNSSSWGNYSNITFDIIRGKYSVNDGDSYNLVNKNGYTKPLSRILFTTGITERNKKMNIYDLAGNLWEWTLEKSEEEPCTSRGGSYVREGTNGSVISYDTNGITGSSPSIGFRATLW